MIQCMIISETDCIVDAKLKTKHSQAAEKALMNMLQIGYAAASADLKDASYRYIGNILTNVTLKGTSHVLFIRNLEQWSQELRSTEIFTQRFFNQKTSTHPLAAFIEKWVDKTIDQWRLTTKEDAHDSGFKVDLTVPPSPIESS